MLPFACQSGYLLLNVIVLQWNEETALMEEWISFKLTTWRHSFQEGSFPILALNANTVTHIHLEWDWQKITLTAWFKINSWLQKKRSDTNIFCNKGVLPYSLINMINSHIVHILTHDYFEVWLQSRQVELHGFAVNFRAGSVLHFCLFI